MLADEFCNHHFAYNGTSDARRIEQRRVIREFETFLEPKPIEQIEADDLRRWIQHLVESNLHVNTVRKRRGMVMPFLRWCRDKGHIDRTAWHDLREVRNPSGATGNNAPRPYSRKEVSLFWGELDQAFPKTETFVMRWLRGTSPYRRIWRHATRLQLEAIVTLALFGGFRREEIFAAQIDHIHPDIEYLIVLEGKGDPPKYREVPYADHARLVMERWLEFRAALEPEHDGPWLTLGVYENHSRNPIRFNTFAKRITEVGHWSLHRMRHTCATEWLRAGMPVEKVRKLMGHATLAQTLAYADVVPDDVRRSMAQVQSQFEQAVGPPTEEAA